MSRWVWEAGKSMGNLVENGKTKKKEVELKVGTEAEWQGKQYTGMGKES